MGDGRYYTGHQFLNVLFLTLLIIFIVVNIVLLVFKSSGHKKTKQILYIYICLCIIAIVRFLEEIVVFQSLAFYCRIIISVLFILLNYAFIITLVNHTFESYLNKKNYFKYLKIVGLFLFIILLYIAIKDKSFIISQYSFKTIEFGMFFYLLVIIAELALIAISFTLILLSYKDSNNNSYRKNIGAISLVFWAIPQLIFVIYTKYIGFNYFLSENILFMFSSIAMSLIASYFMPYRVTASIFTNVKELILDYVFIVDIDGKIIYKNNKVKKSNIFKNTNNMDVNDIEEIFSKEVIKRDAYNKMFIKYIDDESKYFSYGEKDLNVKEILAGKIITFTDITKLIKMLDKLKIQQIQTEKTNKELSNYSKIVYNLEKEKEINNLLNQIVSKREESMYKIKDEIEKLINESDDLSYLNSIDVTINTAKKDLAEVREAVSAYMNYYGGKND